MMVTKYFNKRGGGGGYTAQEASRPDRSAVYLCIWLEILPELENL